MEGAEEQAPERHALLVALVAGNAGDAARLLEAHGAAAFDLEGPCGFTVLHAAALGGCAAVMPALAAAGVPLDGQLHYTRAGKRALRTVLQRGGATWPGGLLDGMSALAIAVRCAC